MFNIIRHFHILSFISKRINSHNALIVKAYYCDKKKIILESLEKDKKEKKKSIPVQNIFKAKTSEEIETVAFTNEKEILQTVTTEKEKDVKVRSHLSKECSTLSDKRITLSSSGLNVQLEQKEAQNMSWNDYMFNKTVDHLKQQSVAPTVQTKRDWCDGIIKTKSSSDGHKPTSSANRIVRREPGKVLFTFVPEEWFQFFIPKTGVTGFGTFLFTFSIYLISKEYYVLEHNFYNGLGAICFWWGAITYGGPPLAKYLDKEVDNYEKSWQDGRDETKNMLDEQIVDETHLQYQADGQLLLVQAKRENVHLQLEEEFRLRQMTVYREVLKRLDYHVAVADVRKRIVQRNLVEYVTRQVRQSITPEMEEQIMNISIDSLLLELEKEDNKNKGG